MAEHHHAHDHDHHADKEPGGHTAKDPVCGMAVDPHTAEHRSQHGGKTWYFCSSRCQSKFDEDPEQYLDWEKKQQEPVAPGTMYTCPMHPEIRQQGPGDCPICGMALEPEQVSLDDGPSEELKDMTRRFWIGLWAPHRTRSHYSPADVQLDSTGAGNACGALVRLALLRPGLEIRG